MRRAFILSVPLIVLLACSARPMYPEGSATTRDDAVLLETIQRAFWENDGVDHSDLSIVVHHGHVTVAGEISNTAERQRILRILRAADGVRSIDTEGLDRG